MKLLLASQIDGDAEGQLRRRHDVVRAIGASEPELAERAHDRHAIVFRSGVSIGPEVLDAPELRLLVRAGSGLDNLDMDAVSARGIELRRIPGPGAQAVAEMTFAHMLGLARQLPLADRLLRQGTWAKGKLDAYNLAGKTLGIIGLGSIGTRVAELGAAWGMRVIGCVEHPSDERRRAYSAKGIELVPDCGAVLERADFVSVHVPLDEDTRGMIGEAELARMKPTAFLVNIARGGVVDEGALLEALRAGAIAGAGLDVHVSEGEGKVSPLAELPNVILTPHIGAATVDAQREIGRIVVDIVDGFSREQGL
jgi:phosphoglycerate dehydrogenase-like enzyme